MRAISRRRGSPARGRRGPVTPPPRRRARQSRLAASAAAGRRTVRPGRCRSRCIPVRSTRTRVTSREASVSPKANTSVSAGAAPTARPHQRLRRSGQTARGLLRGSHHRHRTGHLQRPHRGHQRQDPTHQRPRLRPPLRPNTELNDLPLPRRTTPQTPHNNLRSRTPARLAERGRGRRGPGREAAEPVPERSRTIGPARHPPNEPQWSRLFTTRSGPSGQ